MSIYKASKATFVEFFKLPSKTTEQDFDGEFGVHNYFIDELSFVIYEYESDERCIEYFTSKQHIFIESTDNFQAFKVLLSSQIKNNQLIPTELNDSDFIYGLYETAESGDNDIEVVYERLGDIDIEFEWDEDNVDESYANHFGCRIWSLEADFKVEIKDDEIVTYDVDLDGEYYDDINEAMNYNEDSVIKTIAIVAKSYEKEPSSFTESLKGYSNVFYVNVGESDTRNWDDCKKYGFIAAGQNPKSSKQLSTLKVGDKIVAYLKGYGYVGVGEVIHEAVHINDFLYMGRKLSDMSLTAPNMFANVDNDHAEFLVKVNWLSTVDREKAKWKSKNGLYTTPLIKASLKKQHKTIKYIEECFDINLSL